MLSAAFFDANVVVENQDSLQLEAKISEEEIPALLSYLDTHEHIKTLNLANCDLTHKAIPQLASLPNIEILNLQNNQLGDQGAKALIELHHLKVLKLSDNQISDEGAVSLAKFILKSKLLEKLILTNSSIVSHSSENANQMTSKGTRILLAACQLKNISFDALEVNISHEQFQKIKQEIGKLDRKILLKEFGPKLGISVFNLKSLCLFDSYEHSKNGRSTSIVSQSIKPGNK